MLNLTKAGVRGRRGGREGDEVGRGLVQYLPESGMLLHG